MYGFQKKKLRKYEIKKKRKEWRISLDMFHFAFLHAQEVTRMMKSIIRGLVTRSHHDGIDVVAFLLKDLPVQGDFLNEKSEVARSVSPFLKKVKESAPWNRIKTNVLALSARRRAKILYQ